jgi:hypothetical protein
LSDAQIDLAWEEIDRRHPLDKTPFFAVFPWLRCLRKCSCCRLNRQGSSSEQRSSLIQEAGSVDTLTELPNLKEYFRHTSFKLDELAQQDPIANYGYGVFALKNLLWYMVVFFAFLTVIDLPAYIFYRNVAYGYYNYDGWLDRLSIEKLSLGNTGYNTAVCQTAPMGARELVFTCPVGVSAYIDKTQNDPGREVPGDYYMLGVNDFN